MAAELNVIGKNGPRPKKKRGRNRNTVVNKASKKADIFQKFERLMGDDVRSMQDIPESRMRSGGDQAGLQDAAERGSRSSGESETPSPVPTSGGSSANLVQTIPAAPPVNRMAQLATLAVEKNPKTANRDAARGEYPPALADVPGNLREHIMDASQETGLKPGLLAAVAKVENSWQLEGTSSAGARGPMQTMPFWSDAAEDPFGKFNPNKRPRRAVRLGAHILDHYIDQQGSRRKGLQAYNAGPGNMPAGADYAAEVLRTLREMRRR